MEFTDAIVVVTGAAGNLGRAVVRLFLESGAMVCSVDHKEGRLEDQFDTNRLPGRLLLYNSFDLTNLDQTMKLADQIEEDVGVPEILINTVGGFTYGEAVHQMSQKTWDRMFDLNVNTVLNTAKAFVPAMVTEKRGKIVQVASRSGLQAGAQNAAYASAKSVVIRLTESMAAELLPHRIRVNCVLPGIIDTPENQEAMPNADFAKWVPPEDVGKVIRFLASEESAGVSGAAIPIYGRS
jgi:NAD(P)-dependent dehydrogenase (short-subunit alcohol dehydrogenase family)